MGKGTKTEQWTLYLLTATRPGAAGSAPCAASTHVYARDKEHARERAKPWVAMHPQAHIEIEAFPDGFSLQTRDLAGSITIEVKEESDGK